jgi:hypothetical protein
VIRAAAVLLAIAAAATTAAHAQTLPSSCWGRDTLDPAAKAMRAAPSVFRKPTATHVAAAELAARLLRRFGDPRYVKRVAFGSPPPITRQHTGYFKQRPPRDALWAYIATSSAAKGDRGRETTLAHWETKLVEGALRDDLCAAGGRPLVGWSIGGDHVDGVSDLNYAFNQHFPNPTPATFAATIQRAAARYGFKVVSSTMLRPLQLAPALVVRTDRDRSSFVKDVPAIVALLDRVGGHAGPLAFEGFYFEARDAKGSFVLVENVWRGEVEGGQWTAPGLETPYPHG